MTKSVYAVIANADVRAYHAIILAAITNGGKFDEDFSDVFRLTKAPEGSAAEWVLSFA